MTAGATQLVTFKPDGTDPRWLGHEGAVPDLAYDFTTPGGCNQLTGTLQRSAQYRSDAINPGRLLRAFRGTACAWNGILEEPVPTSGGWELTAHGAGTFGDDYLAIWTGSWGTGVFNNAIDAAIGRGLDWSRGTDVGAVANMWTGQKVESAGQTISDLLDLGCHKGGLTWTVRTVSRGNVLSVFALPTVANRILVSGDPVARSIADSPSTLYLRYQSAWDTAKKPATTALTSVTRTDDEAQHGRREDGTDITTAGTISAGTAQGVGNRVFDRFKRVAFADPFTVMPGELLNQGGQPCDLGLYWQDGIQAMVTELWLADYAYGGEVTGGPINILVGDYAYNDADGTAVVTAFESLRHDFAGLMGATVDAVPVRHKPHHKHKRFKPGIFHHSLFPRHHHGGPFGRHLPHHGGR